MHEYKGFVLMLITGRNSPSTTLWSQLKVADMNDPDVNPPCESLITRFSAARDENKKLFMNRKRSFGISIN
jgi:hypothetical protein